MALKPFLRGAFLSAFSTGVALASLLAVGKMATNALPPEAVALFLLSLLFADGANLSSNLGLFASAPKLVAERTGADRGVLIRSILWGQFGQSAIVSLLLGIAAAIGHGAGQHDWTTIFLWAIPLGFLGAYRDMILGVLAGENRYGMHAGVSILLSSGQAVLVYALVWQGVASPDRLLLAVTLAQACGVALLFIAMRIYLYGPVYASEYAKAVGFSAPLYANTLLNFLFQRADTLLVTAFAGLQGAALYEIAKRFPQVLSRVLNALLLPWLPSVTALLKQGVSPAADRAQRDVLLVVAWIGYAAILFCDWQGELLLRLIASPEYLPAAALLPWLMLGIHFAVQAGVFGQTLIALGRPGVVTMGNVVQAVCSLGGGALMIPLLGLPGAAYAWVIGTVISLAIQSGAVWRMGMRGWVLPWAIVLAAFLVAAWLTKLPHGDLLALPLYVVLSFPGLLPLFARFGATTPPNEYKQ